MDNNERLGLIGLFAEPDNLPFDYGDRQQFILYRSPLALGAAVNQLSYNGNLILDVKYYDGTSMKDVTLQLNDQIVWNVEES